MFHSTLSRFTLSRLRSRRFELNSLALVCLTTGIWLSTGLYPFEGQAQDRYGDVENYRFGGEGGGEAVNPGSSSVSPGETTTYSANRGAVDFSELSVNPTTSLGNNAFDVSPSQLSATEQLGNLTEETSQPNGSQFKRITCAFSSSKTTLTCEVRMSPNSFGVHPNLLSFVITDGEKPDSATNRKQYARFFVDFNPNRLEQVVTVYTYNGSDELPNFQPLLPAGFNSEPITSSLLDGRNSLISRFSKRITGENDLVVNVQLNVEKVLRFLPQQLLARDSWFGTGFGSQFGFKFVSYVGARVSYNAPLFPISLTESSLSSEGSVPLESSVPAPGFIWTFTPGEYTILTANNLRGCVDCLNRKMEFRTPSKWLRVRASFLPSGTVFLPCESTGVSSRTTAVQSALTKSGGTANYVAAQLSILAVPSLPRVEVLGSTLGHYSPAALEGDFVSFGDSIITVNSRVADLMGEVQRTRCEESSHFLAKLQPLFLNLEGSPTSSASVESNPSETSRGAPPRRTPKATLSPAKKATSVSKKTKASKKPPRASKKNVKKGSR